MRCEGTFRERESLRGFTLTELVVVMVLVTILAAVAVPTLNGLGGAKQDVVATRVKSALIYAQQLAWATGNDTWAAFDVGADSVSVFVEDPANPGKANRLAAADPLNRGPMVLQLGSGEVAGVGLTAATFGATAEVQFDSQGIPYDANGTALGADGIVGITGGGTVRVTQNTGLVTID